jgi:hypothetical protein
MLGSFLSNKLHSFHAEKNTVQNKHVETFVQGLSTCILEGTDTLVAVSEGTPYEDFSYSLGMHKPHFITADIHCFLT